VLRVFEAVPGTMRKKALRWVAEMTRGMQLYSHRPRGDDGLYALTTREDLQRYCYFVAGTVGHMLTDLFLEELDLHESAGLALRMRAEAFGVGLQLTNILKDVTDDRERGWSFVPRTACASASIDLRELLDPRRRASAHEVVRPIFAVARASLDEALDYALAVPADQARIRLFCLLPLFMAARTLTFAEGNDAIFVPGSAVKIPRDEVERLIAECVAHAGDDDALRRRYADLWRPRDNGIEIATEARG
jgi:farnesyl-diphosphate farnesyltransferase